MLACTDRRCDDPPLSKRGRDDIGQRLLQLEVQVPRLDRIELRFDEYDRRIKNCEAFSAQQTSEVERAIKSHKEQMDCWDAQSARNEDMYKVERRLQAMEDHLAHVVKSASAALEQLDQGHPDDLNKRLSKVEERMGVILQQIIALQGRQSEMDVRVAEANFRDANSDNKAEMSNAPTQDHCTVLLTPVDPKEEKARNDSDGASTLRQLSNQSKLPQLDKVDNMKILELEKEVMEQRKLVEEVMEQRKFIEDLLGSRRREEESEGSDRSLGSPQKVTHLASRIQDQIEMALAKERRITDQAFEGRSIKGRALLNEGLQYKFHQSIWDACVFINLGFFHWPQNLLLLLAFFVNCMMQMMFITFLWLGEMTTPRYEEFGNDNKFSVFERILKWRALFGHNVEYMDLDTNLPLVKRVCSKGEQFLVAGAQQAEMVKDIRDYLENNVGQYLCLLACLLWIFTAFKELRDIQYFTQAVWGRTYQGSHTRMHYDNSAQVEIESISYVRAFNVTAFICVPRLVIGMVLFITGLWYLTAIPEKEDLILNSIALELIMNIDEILFEVMVPRSVNALMDKVKPIPASKSGRTKHAIWIYGQVFMMLSCVGLVYYFRLSDIINIMARIETTMCNGNLDYVYYTDRGTGVIKSGNTMKSQKPLVLDRNSYEYTAKLQQVGVPVVKRFLDFPPEKLYESLPFTDAFEWRDESHTSFEVRLKHMPCVDIDSQNKSATLLHKLFSWRLGNNSIKTCNDVEYICNGLGHVRTDQARFARALCPVTCLCQSRGNLYRSEVWGCPTRCLENRAGAQNTKSSCSDYTSDNSDLKSYMAEVRTTQLSNPSFNESKGCANFDKLFLINSTAKEDSKFVNLCFSSQLESLGYQSASGICPMTCAQEQQKNACKVGNGGTGTTITTTSGSSAGGGKKGGIVVYTSMLPGAKATTISTTPSGLSSKTGSKTGVQTSSKATIVSTTPSGLSGKTGSKTGVQTSSKATTMSTTPSGLSGKTGAKLGGRLLARRRWVPPVQPHWLESKETKWERIQMS